MDFGGNVVDLWPNYHVPAEPFSSLPTVKVNAIKSPDLEALRLRSTFSWYSFPVSDVGNSRI